MNTKSTEPSENRCQLRFADGRRCALPAHPQGDGLCYPHAHSPHRRLRPSDLTRELASHSGTPIPAEKIHRVLAKLPIAIADGTISLDQFCAMKNLCSLMLQCSRLSATDHA
ncbi:MAG TPA: hypothetical protein VK728_20955 [Candidatus Sulfotelmatobacter sp.]|jgi:hypothetical protein|nr:hypothetical protein [Candidatus Sulfotelmatobacter sp.]